MQFNDFCHWSGLCCVSTSVASAAMLSSVGEMKWAHTLRTINKSHHSAFCKARDWISIEVKQDSTKDFKSYILKTGAFLKDHITLYIDTSNERRKCKCAVGLVGRGVGFKLEGRGGVMLSITLGEWLAYAFEAWKESMQWFIFSRAPL